MTTDTSAADTSTAGAGITQGFQAEVSKLLHLMIHSLYSNREIFLRELVANASDAADKLRFLALSDAALLADDPELRVRISVDEQLHTITIEDNGIGMSHQEVIENLGTIARSGTAAFLSSLSGDQKKDAQLIGQFGVGFYSGFVVASRMEVFSRKAGLSAEEAVHWSSNGEDGFTVEATSLPARGTRVVLHLRDDSHDFASSWRLRGIIRKYAEHIAIPVQMLKPEEEGKNTEWETVNKATALWTRSRSDVSDDEYKEFYRHVAHDAAEPLSWSHNRVEGKLEYTSLMYLPGRAPFDLYQRDGVRGLKLYVQRVFIMDDAEQFLPLYLRFIKGVVDSNDLPLNVSRELLQESPQVESIRTALTKRALEMLAKLAADDAEKYAGFWREFGNVLKEGLGEDSGNRDKLPKLLRYVSTASAVDQADVSLEAYVARMKPEQKAIYYITAEGLANARHSPHLEIFRKHGIEVLLMPERIDEWAMSYLHEFDGKPLQHVARGGLDLGELTAPAAETEQDKAAASALSARLQSALETRVSSVRVSTRLTDSPVCLVMEENDPGAQLRMMMKAAGQEMPEPRPVFEYNAGHALLQRLQGLPEGDAFRDLALVLFDQACIADGRALDDAAAYLQRVNQLLVQ